MNYRFMGKTGLKVSELCLGAMTFGREADETLSHQMLDLFVEAGGNFIDTADVYSQGISETVTGTWLAKQNRDDLVIATKVRFPMGDGPNDVGLSRKHILAGVEASLKRLDTDYIDLYQVHCWDEITPLEETLTTLNDLVRGGLVRYIGVSNYNGWQLQRALMLSKQLGLEAFTCLQPQYNLLCRSTEWELLPLCELEGIGVIPWSPLRGGWLSGKFKRGMSAPPQGSRVEKAEVEGWAESWSGYNNESTWKVLDALHEVANETETHPAQVSLRWLLENPVVTAPIIGARNVEQLQTNMGASGWSLTSEQLAKLNSASELGLPYPYSHIEGAKKRR